MAYLEFETMGIDRVKTEKSVKEFVSNDFFINMISPKINITMVAKTVAIGTA